MDAKNCPGAEELAGERGVFLGGQDGRQELSRRGGAGGGESGISWRPGWTPRIVQARRSWRGREGYFLAARMDAKNCPGAEELAGERGVFLGGQDGRQELSRRGGAGGGERGISWRPGWTPRIVPARRSWRGREGYFLAARM